MKNYFREECKNYNINLMYNKNKVVILSGGENKKGRFIRAHNIFRESTKEVMKAIIDYYFIKEHSDESLEIIKRYANTKFNNKKYSIKPPYNISKPNSQELIIQSITKRDLKGNVTNVKPYHILNENAEEFIELEIVVKDKATELKNIDKSENQCVESMIKTEKDNIIKTEKNNVVAGFKITRYDFNLNPGQGKEVCLVLEPEKRSVICGIVKFANDIVSKDTVVKLFKKGDKDNNQFIPVTYTYIDECGEFLFSVEPNIQYVIKVFHNEIFKKSIFEI